MQTDYFQNKSSIIFYKFFSIVIVFLVFFLLLGRALYPKLFIIWQNLLTQLEYSCGCTSHLSFSHHPWIFSAIIFLGLGLASAITYLMVRIIRIRRQTKKFIKNNLRNQRRSLSLKLERVAGIINLQGRIIEINERKPIIFCYGYIRPRVCISTILVKKLSESELISVLLHEKHHLTNYDPIKLFLIKVTSKILFFVPGLKTLAGQYLILSELAADESATKNFINKAPLAHALAKIIYWHQKVIARSNLAVSFFDAVLPERISRLADDGYTPRLQVITPKLILNLFLFFTSLVSLGILVNFSGSAFSSHAGDSCSVNQPNANQCQMIQKDTCVMSDYLTQHYCQN